MRQSDIPNIPRDGERLIVPRLRIEDVPELDEEYPALDDEDVADLTDGGPRDAGGDPYPSQ